MHSPAWMQFVGAQPVQLEAHPARDVGQIYQTYGDFVWRTLGRFGVPESDRVDQAHEVFIVVHRKLPKYRGDGAMTTWLFGIARRVAAAYRRRGFRVRETPVADPTAKLASDDCPERTTELAEARDLLTAMLDRMSLDQRAVFVMFEIDGLNGREIAELMSCPLQTVFSRLRRARQLFDHEVARLRAIEERGTSS